MKLTPFSCAAIVTASDGHRHVILFHPEHEAKACEVAVKSVDRYEGFTDDDCERLVGKILEEVEIVNLLMEEM